MPAATCFLKNVYGIVIEAGSGKQARITRKFAVTTISTTIHHGCGLTFGARRPASFEALGFAAGSS
ncbi:MAG: hypothetical protein NTZ61_12220 [Proteobacteria bacterium]|nr:hypothetical protein [Pseudomonadota bacterium]